MVRVGDFLSHRVAEATYRKANYGRELYDMEGRNGRRQNKMLITLLCSLQIIDIITRRKWKDGGIPNGK